MHDDGTVWHGRCSRGERGTGWDEKRDGLLCGVRWDQREEQEGTKDAGRTEGCREATGVEVAAAAAELGKRDGMIARSDYVFTRSGGRSGRENSLGSAVPRTAVRLFELCMDTACLQRVLFAVRDSDS